MTKSKISQPAAPVAEEPAAVWVARSALHAWDANPRTNQHAVAGVVESIKRFGFASPIIARANGEVIAGHTRLLAAEVLGLDRVPVRYMDLDPAEAHLLALADNKLGEVADWDLPAVAVILSDYGLTDAQLAGWDAAALDALGRELAGPVEVVEDDVPEAPATPTTKPGDVWKLGEHRLLCGDSTKREDVDRVMGGALADICWTDPPWNIAYDGEESRGRPSKNRPIINDNLGDKFPAFCAAFIEGIHAALVPGGILYLAMSTSELPTIDIALRKNFHWSSTIIWAKDVLNVSRKDYHPQYEPVWYGWRNDAARVHPVGDRKQSDVWEIPRPRRSDEHPTMKPVELVARSLSNSSKAGAVVFDPFAGSGTTPIACEQLGRKCRAIELSPAYCDVIVERWQSLTGGKATR